MERKLTYPRHLSDVNSRFGKKYCLLWMPVGGTMVSCDGRRLARFEDGVHNRDPLQYTTVPGSIWNRPLNFELRLNICSPVMHNEMLPVQQKKDTHCSTSPVFTSILDYFTSQVVAMTVPVVTVESNFAQGCLKKSTYLRREFPL